MFIYLFLWRGPICALQNKRSSTYPLADLPLFLSPSFGSRVAVEVPGFWSWGVLGMSFGVLGSGWRSTLGKSSGPRPGSSFRPWVVYFSLSRLRNGPCYDDGSSGWLNPVKPWTSTIGAMSRIRVWTKDWLGTLGVAYYQSHQIKVQIFDLPLLRWLSQCLSLPSIKILHVFGNPLPNSGISLSCPFSAIRTNRGSIGHAPRLRFVMQKRQHENSMAGRWTLTPLDLQFSVSPFVIFLDLSFPVFVFRNRRLPMISGWHPFDVVSCWSLIFFRFIFSKNLIILYNFC